jgi:hypothetical protein
VLTAMRSIAITRKKSVYMLAAETGRGRW